MTRKAHHVDKEATAWRQFLDPRSYVTGGHEYLFRKDIEVRRAEVYNRAGGNCEGCVSKHFVGASGHMDHIQGGYVGRCWCMHNLRWVCPEFHAARHVRVKWSR